MSTPTNSGDLQLEVRKALEGDGYIVRKTLQFSTSGWTDLEAFKRPMRFFFIEVKTGKDVVRPIQAWRIAQLKYAGFHVFIIREKAEIAPMLSEIDRLHSMQAFPVLTEHEKALVNKPEPVDAKTQPE